MIKSTSLIRRKISERPNLKRIFENITWLFADKLLRLGVGLFVGVWVARYLGPENFGLLSFSAAFVSMFSVFASMGLQNIVVRDIVRNRHEAGEILGTAAALQILGSGASYGLIVLSIFWIRPDDTIARLLVAIIGGAVLLRPSYIACYWFESQVLSKYTVWVQNGSFVAFAMVKCILIMDSAPVTAFAWAILGEAVVSAILLTYALRKRGPKFIELKSTVARSKRLLRDSWPLVLSGLSIVVYMKIDQIMLGQILGNQAVGIYSAAVRVSEVWYFIPTIAVSSVFPAILEAKRRNQKQYYVRLQSLFDFLAWLAIAVSAFIFGFSQMIILLIFGEEYAEAGAILGIHIWALIFVSFNVASERWIVAENRQVLSFQRAAAGAILNVGINLLLIPHYGPIGAAVSTVFSYATAGLFVDYLQKETRHVFYMKLSALNIVAAVRRAKALEVGKS